MNFSITIITKNKIFYKVAINNDKKKSSTTIFLYQKSHQRLFFLWQHQSLIDFSMRRVINNDLFNKKSSTIIFISKKSSTMTLLSKNNQLWLFVSNRSSSIIFTVRKVIFNYFLYDLFHRELIFLEKKVIMFDFVAYISL